MDPGAPETEQPFAWDPLRYRTHPFVGRDDPPPRGVDPLPGDVAATRCRENGRRYLFRPGELLVRRADFERYGALRDALDGYSARNTPPGDDEGFTRATDLERLSEHQGAVRRAKIEDRRAVAQRGLDEAAIDRYVIDALLRPDHHVEQDIPELVSALRDEAGRRNERWHVYPHIVLTGEQPPGEGAYGPGEPPEPLGPIDPPTATGSRGEGIVVAVIDTGVRQDHLWFGGSVRSRGLPDDEELDGDPADGHLDFEAGHGTFVTGVIHQLAPGATLVVRGTLDSAGTVSDAEVAGAIHTLIDEQARTGTQIHILNLSLGGYVHGCDPMGLPATTGAIRALRERNPGLVVTAAAGNNNVDEPFYPAALSDVIGVGALDRNFAKATFSNFGPWVDAWALGVGIRSTYVGDVLDQPGGGGTGTEMARWSGTSFAAPRVAGAIAASMSP